MSRTGSLARGKRGTHTDIEGSICLRFKAAQRSHRSRSSHRFVQFIALSAFVLQDGIKASRIISSPGRSALAAGVARLICA
jgi:hypothetical protein